MLLYWALCIHPFEIWFTKLNSTYVHKQTKNSFSFLIKQSKIKLKLRREQKKVINRILHREEIIKDKEIWLKDQINVCLQVPLLTIKKDIKLKIFTNLDKIS